MAPSAVAPSALVFGVVDARPRTPPHLADPIRSLTYAWLTREMRYESIALIRFCSTVAGSAVSIGLAWQGHDPMSLALGSVVSIGINAAMLLPLRPALVPLAAGFA
jgi:hypothetical protein